MSKSSRYPRLILRSLLLVALLVSAVPAPMLADKPQPSDERAAPAPIAAIEPLAAPPALADLRSDQLPSPNEEASLASAPLMFVENVGQFDKGARYKVYGANGDVWLADDALWITLVEPAEPEDPFERDMLHEYERESELLREPEPRAAVNLRLSFEGANPAPRIEPLARVETKVSYFIGASEEDWHPDVPVYAGVRYVDLYPGLDLEMSQEHGHWSWNMVAKESLKGAALKEALSQVVLNVEGGELAEVGEGQFVVETGVGRVEWPLLVTSEEAGTARREGDALLSPFDAYGVEASAVALADQQEDLVFATYLGGDFRDWGHGITVDGVGRGYVVGHTESYDFPASLGPGYNASHSGDVDTFVVKLDASGTALVYATFLGGGYEDYGEGIAADGDGCVYVAGSTYSSDFPAALGPGYDIGYGSDGDAFAVKLSASGTALVYATFLGGSSGDAGHGIAVDELGCAFVTGRTYSSDFPAALGPGYDITGDPYGDAFVAKLNANGTSLTYATFLGGSDYEVGYGIAVDGSGCAYITGISLSGDFPAVLGPGYDASLNGGHDVFVVKLNANGTSLTYATFLGGSDYEVGYGIAVDGSGCAYITGLTESSDFPAALGPGYDTSLNGRGDVFVVKLNANGTSLTYSTFLGGSNYDIGHGIVVDGAGCAYVTGSTESSDFPAALGPGYDTSLNGGYDAFVVRLHASGLDLAHATFLGGSDGDQGHGIAVDETGCAYVTGLTGSSSFPAAIGPGFDTSFNGGGTDSFVIKLDTRPPPPPPDPVPGDGPAPTQPPPDPKLTRASDWAADETWICPAPDDLGTLQAQYNASDVTPISLVVPIERYYGATDGGGHLLSYVTERGAVNNTATLDLQVYDLDPGEEIEVKLNSGAWRRQRMVSSNPRANAWGSVQVQVGTVDLLFPDVLGTGRAGCEQTGPVVTEPPQPRDNTIEVRTTSTGDKVAVGAATLYLRGVRPTVLVPGYSANACEYGWHEYEDLYYQLHSIYGLELVRPCQEAVHGDHPWICFEVVDKVNPLHPERGMLWRNAAPLHNTVVETITRFGVNKVNLLGHSKGGLFMREYVEGPSSGYLNVENLIALDSVQLGGALVDYYLGWIDIPDSAWEAASQASGRSKLALSSLIKIVTTFVFPFTEYATAELSETSLRSWNAKRPDRSSFGVRYHSIIGYAGQASDATQFDGDRYALHPDMPEGLQRSVLAGIYEMNRHIGNGRGASDPMLTCPEQRIANLPGHSEASCSIIPANHAEAPGFTASAEAVAQALGLTTRSEHNDLHKACDEWPGLTELQGPYAASDYSLRSLDDPQQTLNYTGVLTYGEAVSLTVPVDGTHLEAYLVWEGDEGLALTLTDPNLRLIDATVAVGDDNITYDELRGEPGIGYVGYLITDTVVGGWTLDIAAPASGLEPDIKWELNIAQRSPLSTTLAVAEDEYVTGAMVHLTSAPVTATQPILGSVIVGYDKAPDGTQTPIMLLDDGAHADGAANDGLYGTLLTAAQPGMHTVAITSTGVLPSGVATMRQAGSRYTVLPTSAHFTGLYTEGAVDDDGDGLYDRLVITTTIALDQSGDYEVLGVVSTPDGQELATTVVGASGNAGDTPLVQMSFDGDLLIERPADGPFVLSQLTLIDASVTLPTDTVSDAFTTADYANLDFGGWEARLAGAPTDQGVDTGGGGEYELLRVDVPVEVRRSGDYTVTMDLETSPTTHVGTEPVLFSAGGAGTYTVTLDYAGALIALTEDDGPYGLSGLAVEGPLGVAASLSEVGETGAYLHGDFGGDTTAPASSVSPLDPIASSDGFTVDWSGQDNEGGSGIVNYSVQYRVGTSGAWTDWITDTTLTSWEFAPVQEGATYYFQSKAVDLAGNSEAYPEGDGDTQTTVSIAPTSVTLSGLPETGIPNTNYTAQATIAPASATTPVTYTWTATDHAPVVTQANLSDSQAFTWSTPGWKTVSVEARNVSGIVTDTQMINIAVVGPGNPWIRNYGTVAGGWASFDTYPRWTGDVNGDGRDDVVAFGNKATYVSLSTGAAYGTPTPWILLYGPSAGGWMSYDTYPRMLGDVNGDGRDDIVAFGNKATYVSLSTGANFGPPAPWILLYGPGAGGWMSQDLHPRTLGDVNGDGMDDIVAFGNKATYVSLSTGTSFAGPVPWILLYGPAAGGWTSYDTFPRMVDDVNGDGREDIVAFGNKATYVSLSTGHSFGPATPWAVGLGPAAGGWMTQDGQTRLVGDVDGDNKTDIIAFGGSATYSWKSTSQALGVQSWFFTNSRGWVSQNTYPRDLGDADGDGKVDIVGFGSDGTYVQRAP